MSARIMKTLRIVHLRGVVAATISGSAFFGASAAMASQGPGISQGSASPVIQMGMAIVVYGASALILAAGLIGAARQH